MPINVKASNQVKAFRAGLPEELEDFWPLDFSKEGYNTEYFCAETSYKQAGYVNSFMVDAAIKNDDNLFYVSLEIDNDSEKLDVTLSSLVKEYGDISITSSLVEKLKNFVIKYDEFSDNDENSILKVQAQSGFDKKTKTELWGGHIWATQGFSFDSKFEDVQMKKMRKDFKAFCAEKDINISDKDLKLFIKPCHFVAFDCGVKVKAKNGRETYIGNAFMSEQNWQGQWTRDNIGSVEEKYAKAYNTKNTIRSVRRQKAAIALGKDYINMLRKYAKENEVKSPLVKDKHTLSANIRLMRSKINRAI